MIPINQSYYTYDPFDFKVMNVQTIQSRDNDTRQTRVHNLTTNRKYFVENKHLFESPYIIESSVRNVDDPTPKYKLCAQQVLQSAIDEDPSHTQIINTIYLCAQQLAIPLDKPNT